MMYIFAQIQLYVIFIVYFHVCAYIQCILEWDFPFCNFAKCIVYIEYIYMCVCDMYVCVCVCLYVCMWVCMCVYIYIFFFI